MNDDTLKRIRENEGYTEPPSRMNQSTKYMIAFIVGMLVATALMTSFPSQKERTKEKFDKLTNVDGYKRK